MTSPIAVLLFQALDNYNKAMVATPEKHTLSKALLYTIGTSIFAAVVYKSLLRSTGTQSTFLSVFLKPLHFIFGNTALITDAAETPFEDKYFKEYDAWTAYQSDKNNQTLSIAEEDRRKECLENMYYSTVRETIDDFYGDVIMCYDHATLSFAYYARTANIPYKYLETISRKYMIETNAPREIHVDIRDEYNKAKDRNTPASQTNTIVRAQNADTATADTADTADDTAVFVKLKPYNNASNLNLHTTTNDKSHKFTSGTAAANAAANTADAADTERNSNKIFREKANRYSYRGKITEFDENHKTFLAERRARATATTAADTATDATATSTATDAAGYAEFKKKWMTAKSAL
jgi:hypothetical protein